MRNEGGRKVSKRKKKKHTLRAREEEDKGGKRGGGMTEAREKREQSRMNVCCYPIFHRGDEREKKGIRKEWAEKRNKLVMWRKRKKNDLTGEQEEC